MIFEPTGVRSQEAEAPAATQSGERPLEGCTALAPGTLLAGKYRIKAVLGRGGFATVYAAEQLAFGRDVAVKVLHRTEVTPHVLIERFAREVRISALVRHPHVLEVYDAGVLEDGSPFLAMEKIAGPTLHEELGRAQQLDIDYALELAAQLLEALVAIGAQGIIHRDIKPENLMLARGPNGALQLKLVDFGIALVREERISSRLTAHGALVGTPQYMAPEQLRSEITDARVDLYAAGVVMYQALTGALPHDAPDLSSLTLRVLEGKWQPLRALRPDCPRCLAKLIERALAPDPQRRFVNAASMLAELEACRAQLHGTRLSRGKRSRDLRRFERFLPDSSLARVGLLMLALMAAGAVQAGMAAAFRRGFGGMFQAGAPALRTHAQGRAQPVDVAVTSSTRPAALTRAPELRASDTTERASATASPAATAHTEPPGARPAASAQEPIVEPDVERPAAPSVEPGHPRSAPVAVSMVGPRATASGTLSAPGQRERARALLRRGLSLYLHGDLDAAYAAYRKASQLAPEDPAAFRALGLLASQLRRVQEARRAFARYLELSPEASDRALIRARMNDVSRNVGASELVHSARGEPPRSDARSVL
jgi:serine/threonine-protein kinase